MSDRVKELVIIAVGIVLVILVAASVVSYDLYLTAIYGECIK